MESVHQIEDMEGQIAIGPMRPPRAQGISHVSDTDAARVLLIGVSEGDLRPILASQLDVNRATEGVRIGYRP